MKPTHLYLAALLLGLSACEHELPFDRPDNHVALNLTGLLSAEDSLHTVYVGFSSTEQVRDIPHPELRFYVNDRLVATETGADGYGGKLQFKARFGGGDKVRLTLSAPDNDVVAEVEEVVPLPAEVTAVEMDSVHAKRGMNYTTYENFLQLRITVKDRPGETNYYFPTLATSYTKTVHRPDYRPSEEGPTSVDGAAALSLLPDYNDFILNDGMVQVDTGDEIFGAIIPNRYMAFSDALFADGRGTISVYTYADQLHPWNHADIIPGGYGSDWHRYSTNRRLYVRIHSIDERYYRYLKALNTLDSNDYEPAITEPVALPGNVRGGVGFVGFSSAATLIVPLEDEAFEDDALYY